MTDIARPIYYYFDAAMGPPETAAAGHTLLNTAITLCFDTIHKRRHSMAHLEMLTYGFPSAGFYACCERLMASSMMMPLAAELAPMTLLCRGRSRRGPRHLAALFQMRALAPPAATRIIFYHANAQYRPLMIDTSPIAIIFTSPYKEVHFISRWPAAG